MIFGNPKPPKSFHRLVDCFVERDDIEPAGAGPDGGLGRHTVPSFGALGSNDAGVWV